MQRSKHLTCTPFFGSVRVVNERPCCCREISSKVSDASDFSSPKNCGVVEADVTTLMLSFKRSHKTPRSDSISVFFCRKETNVSSLNGTPVRLILAKLVKRWEQWAKILLCKFICKKKKQGGPSINPQSWSEGAVSHDLLIGGTHPMFPKNRDFKSRLFIHRPNYFVLYIACCGWFRHMRKLRKWLFFPAWRWKFQ